MNTTPATKSRTIYGEEIWKNYGELAAEEARELVTNLRKYYDVERDGEEAFVDFQQLTRTECLNIVSILLRIAQAASDHATLLDERYSATRKPK